jgi:anion-transporting  ArsA/GET3 family ATPase
VSDGSLETIVASKDVVVCAGSGGVGKTTTSAAIAAGMAARGNKVIVLTIDPARRLADALGLPDVGNEECRVDPERLELAGLDGKAGELWAMTLDAKLTFDELIERNAPDTATRDAVLRNSIYRQLSNAVAGSQEYMAMEKLYELHRSGRYDMVVLDTPPSRNALDFLEAPGRLTRFVDSRSLAFFRASGGVGLGLFGRGAGALFAVLKRATGLDLLNDLADFFNSFGGMAQGFRDRARSVEALLRDQRSVFLLITAPRAAAISEAGFFHDRLVELDMPLGGVVVNRVSRRVDVSSYETLDDELTACVGSQLARKVSRNTHDRNRLADRDAENVERLVKQIGTKPIVTVPQLSGDVHELDALATMAKCLLH